MSRTMSPTRSRAITTGTSNGRVFITVYETGCETSFGAFTRRAVKFGDCAGICDTYRALKASVMPSSRTTIYGGGNYLRYNSNKFPRKRHTFG